jgi:mRNA-degrading endonuclease RelE of RelBE toxin-antitoxin system
LRLCVKQKIIYGRNDDPHFTKKFQEMNDLYSFRETKAFTKNVLSLLSEENYYAFQDYLQENYQLGDVIPGGGGLRKIRWHTSGKGKSGGVSIIYYFASEKGYIYLMGIYGKSQKTDLEKDQLKRLAEQVREWLK